MHSKFNISFVSNPLYEFQNVLTFVANKEQYIQLFKEIGEEVEAIEFVEAMQKKMSPFIEKELYYFFGHPLNQNPLGNGCIVKKAITEPFTTNIREALQALETTDEISLVSQMVESAMRGNSTSFISESNWNIIKNDPYKMTQLLDQSEVPQNEVIERIKDCLLYPDETKQRFCMLLNRFYEYIYQPYEEQIFSIIDNGAAKYRELYMNDPSQFLEYYLKLSEEDLQSLSNIHISLFDQVCSVHFSSTYQAKIHHWVVLGIHVDRFLETKPQKEQVDLFLKLISDAKRIRIIESLAERPWYAQELSKKLNLTPAAVSYHMTFFFNLDLVKVNKIDNRHYYLLDKEKMKTYFTLTQSILLKE